MDNTCNTFPTDSLGRRIGVVGGFVSYNDDALIRMINDLNLCMNISDLKFCKNYYYNAKQYNLPLSELYLLDAIAKATRNGASNSALSDIKFETSHAMETYKDLFSKHSDLCGGDPPPLSLSSSALVASKAMKKAGLSPLPAPKLNILRSKNIKLPPETAFVIVLPKDEAEEERYYKNFSDFLSSENVREKIFSIKEISEKGIAFTLSEMADGIYADIFSIPCIPEQPELSHLATEAHGKIIFALSKQNIPLLTEIASEFSLSLSYFAKAIASTKFILLKRDHISLSLDMSLIRSLGYALHRSEAFVGEDEAYTNQSQPLDIIQRDNMRISICEAKFHAPCFLGALNTAVDTILPLCASGADIRNISVALKYSFTENNSNEQLGTDLSCILGVYRLLCELCVANDAIIEYSNATSISLSLVAYTNSYKCIIPNKFSSANTAVYLLSYNADENGIPDFESLRNMLKFYTSLLEVGAIKSARAVRGKLLDALEEMKGNADIVFEKISEGILDREFRGLIVESSIPLDTGILIGSVFVS